MKVSPFVDRLINGSSEETYFLEILSRSNYRETIAAVAEPLLKCRKRAAKGWLIGFFAC